MSKIYVFDKIDLVYYVDETGRQSHIVVEKIKGTKMGTLNIKKENGSLASYCERLPISKWNVNVEYAEKSSGKNSWIADENTVVFKDWIVCNGIKFHLDRSSMEDL